MALSTHMGKLGDRHLKQNKIIKQFLCEFTFKLFTRQIILKWSKMLGVLWNERSLMFVDKLDPGWIHKGSKKKQ